MAAPNRAEKQNGHATQPPNQSRHPLNLLGLSDGNRSARYFFI
jgi:hypothetical protein